MFCTMGFGSFEEAKNTSWISLNMIIADKVDVDYGKESKEKVNKPKSQAEEVAAMAQFM